MKLTTKQIASILKAELIGGEVACDGVSIDTRTIVKNNVFIAIKGQQFDGHDYLELAEKNGAAAVLVDRKIKVSIPQIIVKDTISALQTLSAYWRDQFDIPFIAVTGSCGKTTTRNLIANICRQKASTLESEKSFNNHIGVPLTLLKLNVSHQYAVIEIGASAIGEVEALVQLVKPNVSLVTMAGEAHLEGFGGIEGVAKGKGEIYQYIKNGGVAVINADDVFAGYWRSLVSTKNSVFMFSVKTDADVFATNINSTEQVCSSFDLHIKDKVVSVDLPLMGEHNVVNAVAATAATKALDFTVDDIVNGLQAAVPVDRRLNKTTGFAGATIIDDSYNANPASVSAAIDVLTSSPGKSVLVLGDMVELGCEEVNWHKKIGQKAQEKGVDLLFCFGELSKNTAKQFGENAFYFTDRCQLAEALKKHLDNNTTVMVKGSNSMKMNEVTQSLFQKI